MNERTEAQAGQQKGIVREKRLACEAAYKNVVKLINAMAICEVPAGYSFNTIIDLLNAEIDLLRAERFFSERKHRFFQFIKRKIGKQFHFFSKTA